MSTSTKGKPPSHPPGVIHADELYTLEELQARLQLGDWALRQARQKGLRMFKIGKRKYVKGRDILAYLDKQADPNDATA